MHSHVDQIRPDMQHAVQLAKPKRRSLDRNIAVLRRLSVDCACAWWRLFSIFRRVGLLAPAELGIPITATLRRERLCHVCRSQHALFTHRARERPDEAQHRACCVRSNFIRISAISFQESGLHHCTYSYTDEGQHTTRAVFSDTGDGAERGRARPPGHQQPAITTSRMCTLYACRICEMCALLTSHDADPPELGPRGVADRGGTLAALVSSVPPGPRGGDAGGTHTRARNSIGSGTWSGLAVGVGPTGRAVPETRGSREAGDADRAGRPGRPTTLGL